MYDFVDHGSTAVWRVSHVPWPDVRAPWGAMDDRRFASAREGDGDLVVTPPSLLFRRNEVVPDVLDRWDLEVVQRAGVTGTFDISVVPDGAVFAGTVSSGVQGDDDGTRFTVEVQPIDGSAAPAAVATVLVAGGSTAELRADLGAWAGRAVLVMLTTQSHVSRRFVRTFAPATCREGIWSRPRLGTRGEVDARSFVYWADRLYVLGVDAQDDEWPMLAAMPYAVDAASVTGALAATPPRPAAIRVSEVMGPRTVSRIEFSPFPNPVPVQVGDLIPPLVNLGSLIPSGRTVVQPMGGAHPDASFHGLLIVALERDRGSEEERADLLDRLFEAFRAEADGLLQATVPVGGAVAALDAAASASLQAGFDAIAAGLAAKVPVVSASADPDDLVGVTHVSWGIDVASGQERVSLAGPQGSAYDVLVHVRNILP